MGLQVTASKTDLFLACQRPFAKDTAIVKEEVGEAAKYGSAVHEILSINNADVAAIAAKWGVADCADELKAHAIRILTALKKWMRDTPWGALTTAWAEKAVATNIKTWETYDCPFDAETHTYNLYRNEIGGTADLVVKSGEKWGVIDYKSGDYGVFDKPSNLGQMKTLAVQHDADFVAIVHAPRQSAVAIYADEITTKDKAAHKKALRKADRRIGDGSLRPGPWCKRCPAREGCPAKDGELLIRTAALARVAVSREEMAAPVDKGSFHMFLQEFSRLAERAREVLRADVRAGEIIARPDGKVLVLKKKEYETLSKSSVVRALGKVKGEEMISHLRDMGCVETASREELHAVEEGK